MNQGDWSVLIESPSCGSFLYNKVEEGRRKREEGRYCFNRRNLLRKGFARFEKSATFANRLWK